MGATMERKIDGWVVRQWTLLAWDRTIEDRKVRGDHEDNMTRLAHRMEDVLLGKCAEHCPKVRQVRLSARPQWMFEFTIRGQTRSQAAETALYWIGRAVGGCKGLPVPPMGRQEIEVALDAGE